MAKDFEYAFNKFGAGPLKNWLDDYGDIVLGDGQDRNAYQEFRSLKDDVPEKWAFVKNHEGMSDEEMFDNFINYSYGGEEPMLQVKDVDDHYNGSFVDAGVLSGMLTDTPEIYKATVNWIKGLTGSDLDELNKITSSQTFKDMYGDPDWEGTEQDDYAQGFADVQNSEDPTAPAGKSNSYYDGWNDGLFEKSNTKVGSIAKSITQNDLGREF